MILVRLSLAHTAQRIINEEDPFSCLREHIEQWNHEADALLFKQEPKMTGDVVFDTWIGAAAQAESFLLHQDAPSWAMDEARFLKQPAFFTSSQEERDLAVRETPSFFRNRMLFCGKAFSALTAL